MENKTTEKMRFNPMSEDPITKAYTQNKCLDAVNLINIFAHTCRQKDGRQMTDKEFINRMHALYNDCVEYGF